MADQFANDINMVIADAKAARCDGVLIKSNDEGRRWFQANRDTVDRLHAENLRVGFWGYSYGNVEDFVDAAVRIVNETGCDCYSVDAEAELRNSGNAAALARRLRSALPDFPLGVAPLPIMRYHRALAYPVWAELGYTLQAQIYSNVLGPVTFPAPSVIAEWREEFPDADLAPVYGTYSALENGFNVKHPTPEMMAEFLAACGQFDCIGHSFWRLDTLDLSTLPPEEETLTDKERADIRFQLDVLFGYAGKLRAKKDKIAAEQAVIAVKDALKL